MLHTHHIIPKLSGGKTPKQFKIIDGHPSFKYNDSGEMRTCTFSNVLRTQAQPFVSWLNRFVLDRSTPSGSSVDCVKESNAPSMADEQQPEKIASLSKKVKNAIRKKLIECYNISQNWTEQTTQGLSQSGEILYSGVNKLTFHSTMVREE